MEDDDASHAESYMRHDVTQVDKGDLMEEMMKEERKNLDDGFDFFGQDGDGESDDEDDEEEETLRHRHVLRRADFGWRVPGSPHCSFPGPTIRLARGASYGLVVRNSVPDEVTNLHVHGLHVAGHGNANDITRSVRAGDAILYNYTIPAHHMGGTFWYHAHGHPRTERHVAGGAFGVLVVEDGDDVGTTDENVSRFLDNELTLVLSNNGGGRNEYTWVGTTFPFDKDDMLHVKADEWYRLRIVMVNVDPNRDTEKVTIDGCDVRPIAHDGVFRFEMPGPERKTHRLSLSSRVDLAVRCGDGPSTGVRVDGQRAAMLKSTGEQGDPDVSPFVLDADGEETTWSSTRPPYLADTRDSRPDHRWTIRMGEININDQTYDDREPLCDSKNRNFRYGSLEEWTVRTDSHPLHVHGRHVQIVDDFCGDVNDHGEYYDTVSADGPCKVRARLTDFGGRTTLHCHVYRHGDGGSMGFVNVVGGPEQPSAPRALECADGETDCDVPIEAGLCEGEYDDNEDNDGEESEEFLDDFF